MISLPFFLVAVIMTCGFTSTSSLNSLNGRHLRVIWPLWSGNPRGLSGPLKGGVVLDFLSARLNFTYEMVRVTENRLEPPANGRGLFSYLWDQQCDLIIQDVMPTIQRNKMVDLTTYWIYGELTFLFPVSRETVNINAVAKPFQWPVWLGLCLSILFVISILKLTQHALLNYLPANWEHKSSRLKKGGSRQFRNSDILLVAKKKDENEYLYVFGNLLSQGIPCQSSRLPFRLVAGVWTVVAFFLVQAYTSTLFTYIVMPVNRPLITSVYDIPDNPDINVFIETAGIPDMLLSLVYDTVLYRTLRKRIDSFPNSRCNLASQCIGSITPGTKNIFFAAKNYLKDAINADFKRTGQCHLQMTKDGLFPSFVTFALPKNSPYTKSVSKGLLDLHQIGLIDFWDSWFRPMSPQCTGDIKIGYRKSENKSSSLSLKNLTGPFIIIAVGLSLALLVFLFEQMFYFSQTPSSE